MKKKPVLFVAATFASVGWNFGTELGLDKGRNCSLDDCSGSLFLLGLPYVLFPILVGMALRSEPLDTRLQLGAAVTTAGAAALATALAFMLVLEPSDPDRSVLAGFSLLIVTPIAVLIGMPLASVGHDLFSERRHEKREGVARLLWVSGAICLLIGSMMPWVNVVLGSLRLSTSGIGGNRLGIVCLVGGMTILIASASSRARVRSVVIGTSAVVGLGLGILVMWIPSIQTGTVTTRFDLHAGGGTYVVLGGAVAALVGVLIVGVRESRG